MADGKGAMDMAVTVWLWNLPGFAERPIYRTGDLQNGQRETNLSATAWRLTGPYRAPMFCCRLRNYRKAKARSWR